VRLDTVRGELEEAIIAALRAILRVEGSPSMRIALTPETPTGVAGDVSAIARFENRR
jgi:hypothetical protein